MPKGGAGSLKERVSFAVRGEQDDGYGNSVAGWVEQFQTAGAYTNLRGGETVIAARLENRHPVVVRVRSSVATRGVTSDWRLTDIRTGRQYAIRDVTHDVGRAYIDFLCESGVTI
jgi:SPP1 family predicted phage head-tail adaptor